MDLEREAEVTRAQEVAPLHRCIEGTSQPLDVAPDLPGESIRRRVPGVERSREVNGSDPTSSTITHM